VHAHVFLREELGRCGDLGPEIGVEDGVPFFRAGMHYQRNFSPYDGPQGSVEPRLELMDTLGIASQVLTANTMTFFYRAPVTTAVSFNRLRNEAMAETARTSPRLHGTATLPMQSPEAAVEELHRATKELGLRASHIGSTVGDRLLCDPAFDELWSEHEALGVPVMIHGVRTAGIDSPPDPARTPFSLDAVCGYPMDEGLAVAHLLLGGVLDRHPRLRVLIAHGGGFAPYQRGRLEAARRRGFGAVPIAEQRPFAEVWDQLHFDSALHNEESLAFLLRTNAATNVMVGTNFAGWDHETQATQGLLALDGEAADIALLAHGNAKRFFDLP
jgi:aminocarboxymuconate-semialdehyde decarboxylase